jgi:hypothetical protein
MAIAVSLRTVHFDVKDAERDSVSMGGQTQPRRVCSELRPDIIAENPVTLPWGFTIVVPSEIV